MQTDNVAANMVNGQSPYSNLGKFDKSNPYMKFELERGELCPLTLMEAICI